MRSHGFSLPELTVVIALSALVAAVAVPSVQHALDRRLVESAAQQLVAAHREARLLAATSRRVALLRLAADSIELRLTDRGGDTTLAWRRPGPAFLGVTVAGSPRTVRFIPSGYSIGGSNTSYTITRGAARRKVIISRLGRIRVE
jgi:prepilin-type N-terminal cleavage/methylation domain-containing protein